MCIEIAKQAGYEYCGADELREAVVVNASVQTRQEIMSAIEQLNPGTSTY